MDDDITSVTADSETTVEPTQSQSPSSSEERNQSDDKRGSGLPDNHVKDSKPDFDTVTVHGGDDSETPTPTTPVASTVESSGDEESEGTPSARAAVQKASKLRRKARSGVTLSDEETAFLESYEASKRPQGRPSKEKPAKPNKESKTQVPEVLESKAKTPRLPKPPIVHETNSWRSKYNGGVDNGRELVCKQIGDGWHRLLVAMEKQIAEAGIAPIVEVNNEETRALLVCAVDDMLPKWVQATPAIVGAYMTTMLSTQRLLKAKQIKETMEAKKRPMVQTGITPSLQSVPRQEPEPKKDESNGDRRPKINPDGHYIR